MRLLTICFPTFGQHNVIQLNARGDRIVLAPDEFHKLLLAAGWEIDVLNLSTPTTYPLFRSELPLKSAAEVANRTYDLYWHMFRDPTQPEVLAILADLRLDYGDRPVINHADRLARHHKKNYLPILSQFGLAPQVIVESSKDMSWLPSKSELVSEDRKLVVTYAYNNNRGDYPERGTDRIVTEYVDNSADGMRSIVRFGYAFGTCLEGVQYFCPAEALTFKTGDAKVLRPYVVPQQWRDSIAIALTTLGCDVCHIEAVPTADQLNIIDINPYPTASGKTLTPISAAITQHLSTIFT